MKKLLRLLLAGTSFLLVPGIASASTTASAEARVWAIGLQKQVGIGVEGSLSIGAAVGTVHALVINGHVGSEALRGAIIGGMAGLGLGLAELAITTGATGVTGAEVIGGVHATVGGIAGKALTDRKRLSGQSAAQNLTEFASDAALDLAVTAGVGLGVKFLPESVKEKLFCWILRNTSASPRKSSSTGGGVPKGGGLIDDAAKGGLSTLGRAGSKSSIRVAEGGSSAAEKLFGKLSKGGVDVTPPGHPGKLVRLPDGGFVGFRGISKSGPPTIDVNIPGVSVRKIKFPE